MIDPRMIPIQNLLQGFLKAMAQQNAVTMVITLHENKLISAGNSPQAESLARNHLAIKDGALDAAARALHDLRIVQAEGVDVCALLPCTQLASVADGMPHLLPWEELTDEIREAHKAVVTAIIAAAVAHRPQQPSPILTSV